MARVGVAVQEHDSHRLAASVQHGLSGSAHGAFVQRGQDAAIGVDPFGHFQPQIAAGQRLGELYEQIVDVIPLFRAHLQQVAEPLRGDQA